MGAPVKQRQGYREESATIQRIHRRISEDESRDPAWRVKMLAHLDKLVAGFNEDTKTSLLRKGGEGGAESLTGPDDGSESDGNS